MLDECPASDAIYFPSPQVQRAVPAPLLADVSPAKPQALGRRPALLSSSLVITSSVPTQCTRLQLPPCVLL